MIKELKLEVTLEQLKKIMPNAAKAGRCEIYLDGLNKTLTEFNIDTPLKVSAFLSQIAVESGELLYTRELGNNAYFAKYDTGTLAKRLGNTPEADGDGAKFKG